MLILPLVVTEEGIRVPLYGRQGLVGYALVDPQDVETIERYRWNLDYKGYARTNGARPHPGGSQPPLKMHRLIMQPPPGFQVDRANHNKLDNRRTNLRVCTPAENCRNARPKRGRSLPKGVHWASKNRWAAQLMVDHRNIYLGCFDSIEAARAARVAAELEHHKSFAMIGPACR